MAIQSIVRKNLHLKGCHILNLNGWIIYNGHLPGEKFLTLAKWFHQSAADQGISTTVIKNNDLLSYLSTNTCELIKVQEEKLPDFVIFTDKDIYLAKQLELLGVPVYNSAHAIETSDDKIATYQVLAQHDLPIPKTLIAPKVFFSPPHFDHHYVEQVIHIFGFPLIIKEAFGSFGEQVYLIHTREEMIQKMTELHGKPYVFQQYISSSYGKDLRLHVVGHRVVASMFRQTDDDFRATAGGIREAYEPTVYEEKLAVAATKAIGADFAGVDLLFGPNDTPIICEVNSNAHIGKLYNCTNINVADHIVEYIINALK